MCQAHLLLLSHLGLRSMWSIEQCNRKEFPRRKRLFLSIDIAFLSFYASWRQRDIAQLRLRYLIQQGTDG